MYAHVNVWRLNAAGASPSTAVAHELATRLSERPGFRTYALIRTDRREVVALTVFDSKEQLEDALAAVASLVERRVAPLADGPPERREGEVAYYLSADAR